MVNTVFCQKIAAVGWSVAVQRPNFVESAGSTKTASVGRCNGQIRREPSPPFLLPSGDETANPKDWGIPNFSGPLFLRSRGSCVTDQVDARMMHDIPINAFFGHLAEGRGRTLFWSTRPGMNCGQTHKRSFDTNNPSTTARPEPRP
jgi:hypothetical protein